MRAETEFEGIVREHQSRVFRTLTRLMGTHEGVEDLAQEVFLRLYRALPRFRGEAQLATYLYRIAVNVAHDARSRRARAARREVAFSDEQAGWEDRLAHKGPSPERLLRNKQFQAAVEQALGQLAAAERAALVLYHQEELSYEEIGAALQLPVNTVRTHLHRGRAKLRGLLGEFKKGGEHRHEP